MDCWPAFDRTARVPQRLLGLTQWGPILDHGIGFTFDCWHHYLETGDRDAVGEPYPRLLNFAHYLDGLRGPDGLLPVEGLGVPSVWMDHSGFVLQHHKQCAFNLYAAAMLTNALAPLARAMGDTAAAAHAESFGKELVEAAIVVFWDRKQHIFIDNLRWLSHEDGPRMHDRTLAMSVLFDQCPNGRTGAALQALADRPPEMGFSYPPNQCWRHWALAEAGRIDVVLGEWRQVWARLPSVLENCTMSEDWDPRPDSCDQFSHASVAPLLSLFMDVAGIRPLAPGFGKVLVRPQLGDLPAVDLTAWTVRGPIRFAAELSDGAHEGRVSLPADCAGELRVPAGAALDLPERRGRGDTGDEYYVLEAGTEARFRLPLGIGLGN
jgi:hypothetical protein